MASEFQRVKVTGAFRAMGGDRDGYLREGDFAALAGRWTTLRGTAPGSAEYARLHEIMMRWWYTLQVSAAREDRVTVDDVLTVVDHLHEMPEAVTATAEAMFEAVDGNGDGRISAAEYRQLIEAWNGRPTDTDQIFPRLDLNGDGHLSRVEFTELWTQFWAGDDPGAPGTWVFGPPASGAP
ncbi:EF-hand domain-containing protein [Spirillospora sp. NPDC047279]|uniref:EF-hand domain-containing protein n=1 Tax=Spirillospora sp. NPDC047279 TaxID=3155478 RepID=UPI0033D20052